MFISIPGAIAGMGGFTQPNRPAHITDVICNGFEKSWVDCQHSVNITSCSSIDLAGVICQGIYMRS